MDLGPQFWRFQSVIGWTDPFYMGHGRENPLTSQEAQPLEGSTTSQ